MSFRKIRLVLLFYLSFLASIRTFTVYWNVPSQQCRRNYGLDFSKLLRTYGILVNEEDKFQGNQITIFYESQLGLYPWIARNESMINGGIPQEGNIYKHIEKATGDIKSTIPNKEFSGVGVIDWESWRPSWEFNWTPLSIYRDKSRELAKKNNPSLNQKEIEELAKSQFEKEAKTFMLETLLLAKKLRPLAKWGFYLFPDCYNYHGKKPPDFECSKKVKTENDKLYWLWKYSTGIYPSIYLHDGNLDDYTLEQRCWKDHEKLKEAIRVASPDAEVLPYINFFYKQSFVPQEDFQRMVAQVASVGADGLIIWGSSSSVGSLSHCEELKDYIIQTLGPAIERVSWNSDVCSKQICNGNGSCTWPNDVSVTAWKFFLKNSPTFHPDGVTCKCRKRYSGRFCEKKA